jgi:hypothetical protein
MIRRNILTLLAIGLMMAPAGTAQAEEDTPPASEANSARDPLAGEKHVNDGVPFTQDQGAETDSRASSDNELFGLERSLCSLVPNLPGCTPCGNVQPEETGDSPVYWDGAYGFWIGFPAQGGLSFGQFSNYKHVGLC